MTIEEIKRISAPIMGLFGDYRLEVSGSVRRGIAEPNDLNLLTTAPLIFVLQVLQLKNFPEPLGIITKEQFNITTITIGDLPIRIMSCSPDSWGAAQLYWTGSAEFTRLLRKWAKQQGRLLNSYALWENGNILVSSTEEGICEALGISWLPPEERL